MFSREGNVEAVFAIAKVEVDFSVVEDKTFSMLRRSHGTGINIHVRVNLFQCQR